MYPDLDEFFDVPSSKIDEALVTGDGFVLGTMVDRIAETWRLDAITNEPLWLSLIHISEPTRPY